MKYSFRNIPRRVTIRYLLFQLPALGLILFAINVAESHIAVPGPLKWGTIIIWILKDILILPVVWRSYDTHSESAMEKMVGRKAVVQQCLDPHGLVKIGQELWRGEVRGSPAGSVEAGETVTVIKSEGLKLIVASLENDTSAMAEETLTGEEKPPQKKALSPGRRLPVLMLLMLLPALLYGHSEMVSSLQEIVSQADATAVAEITRITKNAQRCRTGTSITVRPIRFIKGSCEKKSLTFSYTVHTWKPARFFWQEDCPSVHYRIPPRLRNPKKGQQAVITIQYFKDQKQHFVTSMSAMDTLPSIKKILSMP